MVTYYEALSIMKGIRFQTLFAGALIRTIKKRLKDLMILSSMNFLSSCFSFVVTLFPSSLFLLHSHPKPTHFANSHSQTHLSIPIPPMLTLSHFHFATLETYVYTHCTLSLAM